MVDLSGSPAGSVPLSLVVAAALSVLPGGPAPVGNAWQSVAAPTRGPARVIGRSGSACIAGAVPLPLEGRGYQAVDIARRRHHGHPQLVAFIGDLGRVVADRRLGTMLVGDMAQPRGGPMPFGHVSHQGGLDVDVAFRLDLPMTPRARRDGIAQPSVIDASTGRPDPRRWTERHAELVRAAALDPRASRVFVGAAIKQDLCERAWSDRRWLRVVRPWPGHDDHLHVRLRCPEDSPACVDQPPLPPSEGCSAAELAPAFALERVHRGRPSPLPSGVVPPACSALLNAAD